MTVDDVAGTAKELGATLLLEPRDTPGVGRFCVKCDPQAPFISAIRYSEQE